MVRVAAPFLVVIFSMLLESTATGLIMCCFYACLIDHFLVSIFVGVLDCGWFVTSLKWKDPSDDTGSVKSYLIRAIAVRGIYVSPLALSFTSMLYACPCAT